MIVTISDRVLLPLACTCFYADLIHEPCEPCARDGRAALALLRATYGDDVARRSVYPVGWEKLRDSLAEVDEERFARDWELLIAWSDRDGISRVREWLDECFETAVATMRNRSAGRGAPPNVSTADGSEKKETEG
jgi:hypothetical protein